MKVLFCSAEVSPFAKTGGLGDVCGALPLVLEKKGVETSVVMPRYKTIDTHKFLLKKLSYNVSTTKIGKSTNVYFIENDYFFNRDGLYGDRYGDYGDNLDRFLFFCRRSLELPKQIGFKPDIIHCHDWHTALIPVFLKFLYHDDPFYKKTKSILTIHNLAYQGVFPRWDFFKLGLPRNLFSIDGFEFYEDMNILKAGIIFSDEMTTVSPGYAKEIKTDKLGCGLAGVIRSRKKPMVGILNGIDYKIWDPKSDGCLAKTYSQKNIGGKLFNKTALQKKMNLKVDKAVPIFGFVGRLTSQKGLDLFAQAMKAISKLDLQVIFLGNGDEYYGQMLRGIARTYPMKIAVELKYDERLARQIYAGSDILLMPSAYEPCGLSQMIALRYGTIPLVYKTGGLADTITPFHSSGGRGNGFVFDKHKKETLITAIKLAVKTYKDKEIFNTLVKKAFSYRFSWDESAKKYVMLYRQCLRSA